MKLPKGVSGSDVVRALEQLGFQVLRRLDLTYDSGRDDVRVTVPLHTSVAPGTLKNILRQAQITIDDLVAGL